MPSWQAIASGFSDVSATILRDRANYFSFMQERQARAQAVFVFEGTSRLVNYEQFSHRAQAKQRARKIASSVRLSCSRDARSAIGLSAISLVGVPLFLCAFPRTFLHIRGTRRSLSRPRKATVVVVVLSVCLFVFSYFSPDSPGVAMPGARVMRGGTIFV